MNPTLAQLMAALPDAEPRPIDPQIAQHLTELASRLEGRPVPASLVRRLSVLGTLPAKIAAAHLFHWVRGWFQDAEARERDATETRLRCALDILDTMVYLRGAVMKLGQFLGGLPEIVPDEFVRTFERLHFEAPPMHYALVRELLRDELGGDPEEVFAEFERQAFAAASLGQVHRARLKTGELVALKVQYPGIARAVRADLKMLVPLLLPSRLGRDGDSMRRMFDYVRSTVERETDYEREAEFQERARSVFRDEDGIVVPRVHRAQSTKRVLCMDYLEGASLDGLLERSPSAAERDRWGELLMRAWYRLFYAGRMQYLDWNGGNFIFMTGGRLGLIDFGCMMPFSDGEWDLMLRADRPLTTGGKADRLEFLRHWIGSFDEVKEAELVDFCEAWMEWCWRPRAAGGVFDYGDVLELRRGLDLFREALRRRIGRGQPSSGLITRWEMLYRGLLFRLGARIDVKRIAEEEIGAAGWDRTAYRDPTA